MPVSTECLTEVVEVAFVPTELGWFGFAMSDETVLALTIGDTSEQASRRRLRQKLSEIEICSETAMASSQEASRLKKNLERFATGDAIDFRQYKVSSEHLTEFQKKVQRSVRKIPVGETLSYAQVAEQAGSPRAARAVGNVMAQNRTPIVVPCHRVLASGGQWGGFTAPGGVDFKRRLLDLEANC